MRGQKDFKSMKKGVNWRSKFKGKLIQNAYIMLKIHFGEKLDQF